MQAKRSLKIFLKCAVLTLALLLIVPGESGNRALRKAKATRTFYEDTIICAIDTGNDSYPHSELEAGFNYEILRRLAADHGCTLQVRIPSKGENYIDSLILGTIDILVTDAPDSVIISRAAIADTLSAQDEAQIRRTRNVDRRSDWYLRAGDTDQIKDINLWILSFTGTKEFRDLRSRFHRSYNPRSMAERGATSSRLSPYDDLIRKYSKELGWDWRMLAAVVYKESMFAINTVSRRGARGLMQIMPSTAAHYGVEDLTDPEQNLMAGVKFLAGIQRGFPSSEFLPEERVNFTLAAYNAGEGRISDCRIFAMTREVDNTKWDEVAKVIPQMGQYTIEVPDSTIVRTGRFRGTETINYVREVLEIYSLFCRICPE